MDLATYEALVNEQKRAWDAIMTLLQIELEWFEGFVKKFPEWLAMQQAFKDFQQTVDYMQELFVRENGSSLSRMISVQLHLHLEHLESLRDSREFMVGSPPHTNWLTTCDSYEKRVKLYEQLVLHTLPLIPEGLHRMYRKEQR